MKLLEAGVTPQTPPGERKRIRLTNIAALSAPLILLPLLTFYIAGGRYAVALLIGSAMLLYGICFALNRASRTYAARFLCILTAVLSTGIGTLSLGRGAMVQAIQIACIMLPFLLFPEERKRWLWVSLAAVAGAYAIAELLLYRMSPWIKLDAMETMANYHLNMIMLLVVTTFMGYYLYSENNRAERSLVAEKAQSEALLLNMMPLEIAMELKATGRVCPRLIDSVTVMFTDFEGFTAHSANLRPEELIHLINEYFTAFDEITSEFRLEKLKTIGDSFMCAGGLLGDSDHAQRCLRAAQRMCRHVHKSGMFRHSLGLPYFNVRIGLHTGPVVAGVVGRSKFSFDIWGDTVNTAARIQSAAPVGGIALSEATLESLEPQTFPIYDRGTVVLKGKGPMQLYGVGGTDSVVAYAHGQKPARIREAVVA